MLLICCRKSHYTPASIAPAHTPSLFSIDLHTIRRHLVFARILLPILSGTVFQMMSGVPHHCHHLSLVWGHTCFVLYINIELLWVTVDMCIILRCHWLFCQIYQKNKNAIMCIKQYTRKFFYYPLFKAFVYISSVIYDLCVVIIHLMLFVSKFCLRYQHMVSLFQLNAMHYVQCYLINWFS